MVRWIGLFLVMMSSLFANTAVTENDPSTLVNGVSVITGDLFTYEEDYRVQGYEPISLRRAYLSSAGNWNPQPHLIAVWNAPAKSFSVCEPNGTTIHYTTEPTKKKHPPDVQRFDCIWRQLPGVTNTAAGKISAHTNYKNQYLVAPKDRLSFTVHAADGTKRIYKAVNHQEKTDFGPFGDHYLMYVYALHSEELPNGNTIEYQWDQNDHLFSITTKTKRGNVLAKTQHPGFSRNKPPVGTFCISGSDRLSVCYKQDFLEPKRKQYGCLQAVELPNAPNQSFGHTAKQGQGLGRTYLESITLGKQRTVFIDYEQAKGLNYRVKCLRASVGEDNSCYAINTFHYHSEKTFVDDAYGNRMVYFWNKDQRLTRIDVHEGQDKLHHSERFVWDGAQIRCKSHLNERGEAVYARTFAYDERGNVREETFWGNLSGIGGSLRLDDSGMPAENGIERSITRTEYNEQNLPTRQEEPNGLVTLFEYVPGTHLLKSKVLCDRSEPKIRHIYEYDDEFILIREVVDDGITHTIRQIHPRRDQPYYGLPNVIEERYGCDEQLLRKTSFSYGRGARVEKKGVYDAGGNHQYDLEFRYDAKGNLVLEVNALGWEATAEYDELGNKTRSQDVLGNTTTYQYDQSNRLTCKEMTGFDAIYRNTKYTYNKLHHLAVEEDSNGHETRYATDPFGNIVETRLPENVVFQSQFDSMNLEIEKMDGNRFTTQTRYNAYGKPILVEHPDGSQEQNTYFIDGSLKSSRDPVGIETHYIRDYLGRITSKEVRQHGETLSLETFEYTGQLLTSKIDAEGHKTYLFYDKAGRKIAEEFEGVHISYEYNPLGQIQVVEKGGVRVITEYDLLDRIIEEREEVTQKVLHKVRYAYDRAGNKTDIWRWVDGQETNECFTYDSQNRLTRHIDPSGAEETTCYEDDFCNDKGQKVLRKTHTDPMGLQTIETFDPLGRLISIEKYKGRCLLYTYKEYDLRGKLIRQTDTIYAPNGNSREVTTRWEYDSRGRTISIVEADGTSDAKTTRYTYTPREEKATIIKPDGVTLFYEYNGLGHNTGVRSSDGTVHHVLRYNRLGHLIEHDQILCQVDPHGRTLAEEYPQGYGIENRYNTNGKRVECRIPQADCTIDYAYEGKDLCQVTRKTSSGVERYIQRYLRRDLTGNILESELPNGLGTLTHSYDLCSRKKSVQTPAYCQQVLKADLLGNICKLATQNDESIFTYDELYQLTSERGLFNHEYAFDTLNCRLQKEDETYEINALNQIVSHIEYDPNGNPRRQGATLYTFDALNRLIQLETPNGIERYIYDALHRRISIQTPYRIRYFLYDGQNEIGSFDENLNIQELRVLGEAPHAEIGAAIGIELKGDVYVPIHDLSGNIAALISLDREDVEVTRYSAYGEESGSKISPWRFSSKRVDATGLVYYGRRYYHPEFGRWLSPDPAKFTDGMNLYAFVHNNSLIYFDEYGLVTYVQGQGWQNSTWGSPFSYTPAFHAPYDNSPPQYWNRTKVDARLIPSLDLHHKYTPHFYVNGILNTRADSLAGARSLKQSLGSFANVIPIYSESFGVVRDLISVYQSRHNNNYTSFAVRRLNREVRSSSLFMDLLQDPRKIFITAFSRGAADTYHAVKTLSPEQKDRLMITACGPIMILPRDLGFSVTNLISSGDWCSKFCNFGFWGSFKKYDDIAKVQMLPQIDGFSGFNRDHFFLSQTYQQEIIDSVSRQYQMYGGPR